MTQRHIGGGLNAVKTQETTSKDAIGIVFAMLYWCLSN